MDCKDLMIGDLVQFDEDTCVVEELRVDGTAVVTSLNTDLTSIDGDQVDVEEIYPIPLTEEILVKNGWDFTKSDYSVYCKEDTNGDAELSKDQYGFYWSINCDEYVLLRIDYVHQLQHLLRLCGIEKEIEL